MVVVAHCGTQQRRALILTAARQKFDLDPWPWPRPLTLNLRQRNSGVKTWISPFDLDLWPMTLTYNPNLAKVKVDLCTKYQGRRRRSNGSGVRALTDGQTDDGTKRIICLLCYSTRSIIIIISREIIELVAFVCLFVLSWLRPSYFVWSLTLTLTLARLGL